MLQTPASHDSHVDTFDLFPTHQNPRMDIIRRLAGWLDRPGFPWKSLIVTFSIGEYFLENWLAYRQYKVLQGTRRPKQLENEVDQKTHDKSQVCCLGHYHIMVIMVT